MNSWWSLNSAFQVQPDTGASGGGTFLFSQLTQQFAAQSLGREVQQSSTTIKVRHTCLPDRPNRARQRQSTLTDELTVVCASCVQVSVLGPDGQPRDQSPVLGSTAAPAAPQSSLLSSLLNQQPSSSPRVRPT